MRKKSIEELTEELGEILKDIYETEGLEKARNIVTDTMQKVEQNIIGDLQNKSEWDLILSQIEEMARNLTGPRKIADQLNCTVNVVYTTIRKKEIYNRRDVRKLMAEGKSDEEIANEGLCAMESWMKEIGLVMNISELGVTEDMLEGIANGTFIMEGGYKTLNHNEILQVLKESMI